MKTIAMLALASLLAVGIAVTATAQEKPKKAAAAFTLNETPAILTHANTPKGFQIGIGSFRVRHMVGGPVVAWAWRENLPGGRYFEKWITLGTHKQPGSEPDIKWHFTKIDPNVEPSVRMISHTPGTFTQWVTMHGAVGGQPVAYSLLKYHYLHDVTRSAY